MSSKPITPATHDAGSAGHDGVIQEGKKERKKTPIVDGRLREQPRMPKWRTRQATVGSDQLRLTQASELNRFPDFGCAHYLNSTRPHMPTRPQDAGASAVALPTVGSVGHGISLSRMCWETGRQGGSSHWTNHLQAYLIDDKQTNLEKSITTLVHLARSRLN